MCSKRMKEEAVFSHLDRCDGKHVKDSPPPKLPQPKPPPPQARMTNSPAKHLPHLNYSLLKDGALKKKLQELEIPTWGARQLLIRRHTQWVDIYNANSDSPRPKAERQLLKELDVWERTQGGHAPGQGQSGPVGVMRKDFDGGEWTGKHKDQFSDLIAQARAKRKAAATAETKEAGVDQITSDGMEDITPAANAPAGSTKSNGTTLPKAPPKIHTAAKSSIPNTSSLGQDLATTSPVASMLASAAKDIRRRSSISTLAAAPIPGLISTHSIPSASSTPLHPLSSQTNGHRTIPAEHLSETGPSSLPHEDSLGEKLAAAASESVTQGEGAKMKTVDMFRLPESPIHDVELGAGTGGG
jgi:E3 ubiquitin-protein ligase RAD18